MAKKKTTTLVTRAKPAKPVLHCVWPDCKDLSSEEIPLHGVEVDDQGEAEELEGSLALPFCAGHIVYAKGGLVAAIIVDDQFSGQLYGNFDMIRMMETVARKVLAENSSSEEETEEEPYGG